MRERVYNVADDFTLHTRVSVAAHFLFVGKHRKHGMGRIDIEYSLHFGIRANLVVVTVRGNQRAVEADVPRLSGRHEAKLRALKIYFGNTVFLIEKL